jgi:3-hydroxyisobutyrate dehydrogenase-like beta-hydroxyacid dehydrogenase
MAAFPLRLMFKDYRLILDTAMGLPTPMPATAAAEQVSAAEFARQSAAGSDEDFSSVVRTMEWISNGGPMHSKAAKGPS